MSSGDVLTPEQRRKCMSAVRRENTKPEMMLRSTLHRSGLRYRVHGKKLPGSPDLVFPSFNAVIFVHGCFWHSHGCYKTTVPKTRRTFWEDKLQTNRERDVRSVRSLHEMGWRVMIVWECAVRGKIPLPSSVIADSVKKWLHSSELLTELPFSTAITRYEHATRGG